ncbi:hypothetical protein BaRGS_00007013, partial [Batillaria attramentaria]
FHWQCCQKRKLKGGIKRPTVLKLSGASVFGDGGPTLIVSDALTLTRWPPATRAIATREEDSRGDPALEPAPPAAQSLHPMVSAPLTAPSAHFLLYPLETFYS